MMAPDLTSLIIIILASVLVGAIFAARLNFMSIFGYIIAGIVIGPSGFSLLSGSDSDAQTISVFSEFGLVLLLFIIGLQFGGLRFTRDNKYQLAICAATLFVTACLLSSLMVFYGLPLALAVILGLALAVPSPGIIFVSQREMGLQHTEAESSQNAFVIVGLIFTFISSLLVLFFNVGLSISETVRSIIFFPGWFLLTYFIGWTYGRYSYNLVVKGLPSEVSAIATLVLVLSVSFSASLIGLPAILTAPVLGLAIARSKVRYKVEADLAPYMQMLIGIFFLSVGTLIDIYSLIFERNYFIILLALLTILVTKILVALFAAKFLVDDSRLHSRFACSLASPSETTFAVLSLIMASGITAAGSIASDVSIQLSTIIAVALIFVASSGVKLEGPAKPRVFISYSRLDADIADVLVNKLQSLGFELYFDKRDLLFGQKWQDELEGFIRGADVIVWLVSEPSVKSDWCKWELEQSRKFRKRIVPVMVKATDIESLPDELGKIQLFPRSGVLDLDERKQIFELVDVLTFDAEWGKQYTLLISRARAWEEAGRNSDFLLKGRELSDAEKWYTKRRTDIETPIDVVRDFLNASMLATK